ncbi:MAG: hypothetical protein JNM93_01190, partial [Bacteriovoracaceae bacterium]|nr:hypothetical protein [Bacteriovoracaceae bacterium]
MVYANRSTAHYCDKFVLDVSPGNTVEVYQSKDAGAYYCEHAFCVGVKHAGASQEVGIDANGHKLVGFLHIAPDKHLFSEPGSYVLSERHSKTRVITASAIKSYFASLVSRFPNEQQFKILLTGYNRFSVPDGQGGMVEITNNPSQDFVKNPENIDSVMELAFGAKQVKAFASADEQNYVINTDGR